ncbi:MAG: GTPase HflX [Planctomycetota bacterium]|nr:MAG: GTPase HflX [Planctomycetota bacterium]
MTRALESTHSARERVVLCGVLFPDAPVEFEGALTEAGALVEAAHGRIVGQTYTQSRAKADPATLMGKGKVHEVEEEVRREQPDAVVFDNDLSPAQVRNLEKIFGVRVIDRSELILDIFSRRAQTRQARLQVELAQNEYLLPRLRRMWTHLERTEGAIGTRGPGETQLETDRRLLRKRVRDLRADLKEIEARKLREVRTRGDQFTIGLVGYTNAGKSTLLNRLTESDELVADMPFATLDTRTRRWRLPDGRQVLVSDTVGFLQRLPHHLVASFHATLEETVHADLLVHVVDASHPDAAVQMQAVDDVLESVSSNLRPGLLVFNKVDLVKDPISLQLLLTGDDPEVVYISAVSGDGIDRLTRLVAQILDEHMALVDVTIPTSDGRTIALLKSYGAVLEEECLGDVSLRIRARLGEGALGNLRRQAGPGVRFDIL